jgi:hypothetical protein
MLDWVDPSQKHYKRFVKRSGVRPLECVQRAGEVAFVPTGWNHATINLEPTVGMAYEVGDSCPPQWSAKSRRSRGKKGGSYSKKLVRKYLRTDEGF